MTEGEPTTPRLQLETEKLEAEVAMITAQTKALVAQQSWQAHALEGLKALAGLAGLAAIIGLLISGWHWKQELDNFRQEKIQDQINKGFDNLSADTIAKKLSGLSTVRSFMAEKNTKWHRQIMGVLVSTLAIEKDPNVRDPIISMLRTLDKDIVEQKILDETLAALIEVSRTRVLIGDLKQSRMTEPLHPTRPDSDEAIAKSIGAAIMSMLRLGARSKDMSDIYCARCDFTGLDLSRTKFSNSILFLADFKDSTLVEADFDGADLDSANFISADLRGALLSQRDPRHGGPVMDRVHHGVVVHLPVFDCADLRNVSFDGHPLFGFYPDERLKLSRDRSVLIRDSRIVQTSFYEANLEGTKFDNVRMFAFLNLANQKPVVTSETRIPSSSTDPELMSLLMEIPGLTPRYKGSFSSLRDAFNNSNWKSASFSPVIRNRLDADPPRNLPGSATRQSCQPRNVLGNRGSGGSDQK